MSKTSKVHHIPPDRALMEKIAGNFTLAEAIVELVANSIDARPIDKHGMPTGPLEVDVTVNEKQISVVDNGVGMTEKVLAEAVRLGVNMDEVLGHRMRKGIYGLGLKTAAASIGRVWSVLTRPAGDKKDYFLEFNLETYGKKKTSSLDDWSVEIETRERGEESALGDRKSGTAVVITRLRDSRPMSGAVTSYLAEAYKPHLESGDIIKVNGDMARPIAYRFLEGCKWEINQEVRKGSGWFVRGWVAIDSQTHNDGKYGFNLYRSRQLIETWNKDWFSAHLMTSRIIGEAHIDFMPVNFNKQGFKTQSDEWKLTQEHMSTWMADVVRASRAASRGREQDKARKAQEGFNRARKVGPSVVDDDTKASEMDGAQGEMAEQPDENRPLVAADTITYRGRKIKTTYDVSDWGSDVTPWDYAMSDYDGGFTEIQTILNSSSLLYKRTSDQSMLSVLAMADSVTRYLVEHWSLDPKLAREIRDRWIQASLKAEPAKKEAKTNE